MNELIVFAVVMIVVLLAGSLVIVAYLRRPIIRPEIEIKFPENCDYCAGSGVENMGMFGQITCTGCRGRGTREIGARNESLRSSK